MSVRIPTRRVGQSALAAMRPRPTGWNSQSRCFTCTIRFGNAEKPTGLQHSEADKSIPTEQPFKAPKPADLENPILESYLRRRDPHKTAKMPDLKTGKLAPSTIFKPEYEIPGWDDALSGVEKEALKKAEENRQAEVKKQREYDLSQLKLDPAPAARRRFERQMVIKELKKRGRVTKAIKLFRTERQSLYKSDRLPTSVKKLTKIMNMIKGKTVDEALVQLRFSKKRIARDVLKGLQIARDEAIATRGMGLGPSAERQLQSRAEWIREGEELEMARKEKAAAGIRLTEEELEAEKEEFEAYRAREPKFLLADGTRFGQRGEEATQIELEDGTRKLVYDPTEIYIDQAWVGRGESWASPEARARGRTNLLTHRTTSFSVLLKEEKTRIRLSEEMQKKRENRKIWMPLPDRPITSQRQYCLW